MNETRIPFDSVRRHAHSVEGISAELMAGHDAANQTYVDTGAFGQLCQFLPRLFDPVLNSAATALAVAATALTESAAKLRRAADSSETTDAVNATTITRIGGRDIDIPI